MFLRIALVMFLMGAATPLVIAADPVCKCPCCAAKVPPIVATAPKPAEVAKDGRILPGREPVSFEDALREEIETRPETIRSRRILNVLDMDDGPRRTRILNRMERHAIVSLEIRGEAGAIDWQNINWEKIFDVLMKLLALLLPLLLAL